MKPQQVPQYKEIIKSMFKKGKALTISDVSSKSSFEYSINYTILRLLVREGVLKTCTNESGETTYLLTK